MERSNWRGAKTWLVAAALAASLLLPAAASAQGQMGSVILDSNEQLFDVLAAVNLAGYDTDLGVDTGNDTRDAVRAYLEREKTPIVPELRKFYAEHRDPNDSAADLGQFVSLAILLGPPPEFKFTVDESDLPPDARSLRGFVPLLRTFYNQAGLIDLWARVQPRYVAEIDRYSDSVRQSIGLSDAYLHSFAGAYLGRTFSIYLSLLAAPNQQQARIYGDNYYLVITPSKQTKIAEIRHQYLHFLLDPLALKYAAELGQKASLAAVARKAPALAPDFKDDFSLLATECLIRAIELRMDKTPKAEAQKKVGEYTAAGLILVPYFYEALDEYEKQESAFSIFYKQMIVAIDPTEEAKALAGVKYVDPAAAVKTEAVAPVARTEVERLLDQADNEFYRGNYSQARSTFEQVLAKDPKSGRALFGIAVAASNMRKPDTAEEYFTKALDVARDLRIVTWSHIYLGRIDDLLGERKKALAEYHAAELTAAAFPLAVAAVQDGLQKPYGSR